MSGWYFLYCRIWRELFLKFLGTFFLGNPFSLKRGAECSKRGPKPPFLDWKRGSCKFFDTEMYQPIMCKIPQLWDFHFHPRLHYGGRLCRQIPSLFCMCILRIDVNTLLQRRYFTVGLLDAQCSGADLPKNPTFPCVGIKESHNTKHKSYYLSCKGRDKLLVGNNCSRISPSSAAVVSAWHWRGGSSSLAASWRRRW